ncbi:hypothetical protein BO86DRAFT_400548 [Aspergillus japonicus CBS 114.51]|uniref:Uncharacterized protein n=2 Tax=Aspergillus TaxID=5052 RepID=A0A2V5GQ70_ASPV1|nr:hypothetical protein BO86DRAFT_400548 [Aspergillus japonicus CBS 114.51]PYI12781.1 hypothetical protein BO99DRAFT_438846 [Aspergillus violaceofuscus CBS 115571]RAH80670.1 hypothetical protein BO86DRAFT_400548 [Aspergillus japonicus CBS 114.51]
MCPMFPDRAVRRDDGVYGRFTKHYLSRHGHCDPEREQVFVVVEVAQELMDRHDWPFYVEQLQLEIEGERLSKPTAEAVFARIQCAGVVRHYKECVGAERVTGPGILAVQIEGRAEHRLSDDLWLLHDWYENTVMPYWGHAPLPVPVDGSAECYPYLRCPWW